jgi:hypothetical protein
MKNFPRALPALLSVLAALLLTGCGFELSTQPDELDGKTLAERANSQLEKQNPDLRPGDLTCKDVQFEEDATARCVRTVVFDDGRLVRIGATVTITDTDGKGRFAIKVDEEAQEFGVTGRSVFEELTTSYEKQYGVTPTGSCPEYLPGKAGETITCELETPDETLDVVVTVTGVDPETFETRYSYRSR